MLPSSTRKYVVFFFLIPAILLISPVLFSNPFQNILGSEYSDSFKHVWSFWHTPQSLFSWPHTEYLNAPRGGLFYDLMLLPAIVMTPVSLICGPIFAANLWIVISLVAVGYCTFLLCEYLKFHFESSIIGGLMAMSSPYLLGYPLTGGVYERLGIWLFPLLILCTFKFLESKTRKWLFVSILSYTFVVFGCPIYGVYSSIIFFLLLPFLYHMQKQYASLRELITLVGCLIMSTIFIYFVIIQLNQEGSIAPQVNRLQLGFGVGSVPESATIFGLLNPLYMKPVEVLGDAIPTIHYVGWTIVLPILMVFFTYKRQPTIIRYLTVIIFTFLLLSMGPNIRVQHTSNTIVNPIFYIFSYLIPYLGVIPTAWQMVSVVTVLGSVVAVGCLSIISKKKWLSATIILLILCGVERRIAIRNLDFRSVLIQPTVALTAIIEKEGYVVEIPRSYMDIGLSRDQIFANQMFHQRPTSIAINLGTTKWDQYSPILAGVSDDWTKVRRCLLRGGYRYVIVHKDLLSQKNLTIIRKLGTILSENTEAFVLEFDTPKEWSIPLKGLGPSATSHHAEVIIGEFGIDVNDNSYISETCPFEDK